MSMPYECYLLKFLVKSFTNLSTISDVLFFYTLIISTRCELPSNKWNGFLNHSSPSGACQTGS
ncbi:MAG: hypothetical protein ACFFCD_11630, partial [Promethearchaeota archaeon]